MDLGVEGDVEERKIKIVFHVSAPGSQMSWRFSGEDDVISFRCFEFEVVVGCLDEDFSGELKSQEK